MLLSHLLHPSTHCTAYCINGSTVSQDKTRQDKTKSNQTSWFYVFLPCWLPSLAIHCSSWPIHIASGVDAPNCSEHIFPDICTLLHTTSLGASPKVVFYTCFFTAAFAANPRDTLHRYPRPTVDHDNHHPNSFPISAFACHPQVYTSVQILATSPYAKLEYSTLSSCRFGASNARPNWCTPGVTFALDPNQHLALSPPTPILVYKDKHNTHTHSHTIYTESGPNSPSCDPLLQRSLPSRPKSINTNHLDITPPRRPHQHRPSANHVHTLFNSPSHPYSRRTPHRRAWCPQLQRESLFLLTIPLLSIERQLFES